MMRMVQKYTLQCKKIVQKKCIWNKIKIFKRKGGTGKEAEILKMDITGLLIWINVYCSQKHLSENNLHQLI